MHQKLLDAANGCAITAPSTPRRVLKNCCKSRHLCYLNTLPESISRTGLVLAGLYLAAFAFAYASFLCSARSWMDDLSVELICFPYSLMVRLLTGNPNFEVGYKNPFGGFYLPGLICTIMFYGLGAGLSAVWCRLKPPF